MEMMEIVLLIAGGIIFVLSFFIPDKKNVSGQGGSTENVKALAEDELKGLVDQEMASIRTHVDDVVEEAVTYAMEKTERSLERLSNEKIMAVSEYSDTVLKEIHKSHEEAMFLYDMLNNKHVSLKNTVSEVNRTVKNAEEAVLSFQKRMPEKLSASEGTVLNRAAEPAVQREQGRYTQGGFGTDGFGFERAEIGSIEIEKSGINKSGIENSGIGKSGIERLGAKQTKTESVRIERTETNNSIPERNGIQDVTTEKKKIQNTGTEKSGLERLGASTENVNLGKVSFMQDVDEQGCNNNERILELFQQGRSTVAIARELGLGVGEVKLVIDLFKNQ